MSSIVFGIDSVTLVSLIANSVSDAIAAVGLLIVIWARLSLGRNIGFVPAQRELVDSGAYAFMRHPVYTGSLVTNIALLLRAFSPLTALLLGLVHFGSSQSRAWSKKISSAPIHNTPHTCAAYAPAGFHS